MFDFVGNSRLVNKGTVVEKINKQLTNTTQLSYFLVDFIRAYFFFVN